MQKNRTVESDLKRGEAGRMSFCDLLIGSAMHRLAPSRQSFALDGRKCNERTPILFTTILGFTPRLYDVAAFAAGMLSAESVGSRWR